MLLFLNFDLSCPGFLNSVYPILLNQINPGDLMKIKSADFVKSAVWPSAYPKDNLPQIAFAGRSNVGKSSLINSLTNRKSLARISKTPGRTQLINFFNINNNCLFVDLPGYGYAKVPTRVKKDWNNMIVKYMKNNENLKLLISILDARRVPSRLDIQLMEWLLLYEVPFIFVVTKADKLSKSNLNKQIKIIRETLSPPDEIEFMTYSSPKKLGRVELLSRLDLIFKK
jgi:GTP-binding protein